MKPIVDLVRDSRVWLFSSRIAAVCVLAIAVVGSSWGHDHAGSPVYVFTVAMLVLLAVGAGVSDTTSTVLWPSLPRWSTRSALLLTVVTSGTLAVLLKSGTAVAAPLISARMITAARLPMWAERALLALCILPLWLFTYRINGSWWEYLAWTGAGFALYLSGLRARDTADRHEQTELALAREQALRGEHARAAAAEERNRIARDLHDVLAHTLSGLAITLQTSQLILERDGASEQARAQVAQARTLAVEGLTEARHAVAALGAASDRSDHSASAVHPSPDTRAEVDLIATLDRLVRDHRAITRTVATLSTASADGAERMSALLPAATVEAIAAVTRESLTNTLRHAPGAPVEVIVAAKPNALVLTVADTTGHPAAPAADGGMGLAGMRARAVELGGTLEAGPTPTGWQVQLRLPCDGHVGEDRIGA